MEKIEYLDKKIEFLKLNIIGEAIHLFFILALEYILLSLLKLLSLDKVYHQILVAVIVTSMCLKFIIIFLKFNKFLCEIDCLYKNQLNLLRERAYQDMVNN
ncbi:hypothetical protein JXB41_03370 [Candidatus Woesearchaeota archaeon]|nr:hypothetical protein [Candidatus Woesearchaeota archaeon]